MSIVLVAIPAASNRASTRKPSDLLRKYGVSTERGRFSWAAPKASTVVIWVEESTVAIVASSSSRTIRSPWLMALVVPVVSVTTLEDAATVPMIVASNVRCSVEASVFSSTFEKLKTWNVTVFRFWSISTDQGKSSTPRKTLIHVASVGDVRRSTRTS